MAYVKKQWVNGQTPITADELNRMEEGIAELDSRAADYVIDEGISKYWEYRKWKSGKLELWREKSAQVEFTRNRGNYGFSVNGYISEYFPFEFLNNPKVFISFNPPDYGTLLFAYTSTSKVTFDISNSASTTGSLSYNIYAVGTAK